MHPNCRIAGLSFSKVFNSAEYRWPSWHDLSASVDPADNAPATPDFNVSVHLNSNCERISIVIASSVFVRDDPRLGRESVEAICWHEFPPN